MLSLFAILFFNSANAAQNKNNKKFKDEDAPTRIRSDLIDIKRKSQIIDFIGNVVVEKGDSSMLSQKMTVFYDEANKKSNSSDRTKDKAKDSSIKRIEAKDSVKIFSEEFVAVGDSGYYDPKENIFVLEDNVKVNNGTSIASGDKFVYSLETKKGNFVGKKRESLIGGNKTISDEVPTDKRVVVIIGDDYKDNSKNKK